MPSLNRSIKALVPAPAREWARHYRQYRIAAVAYHSTVERLVGERYTPVDAGETASPEVVSKTALMKDSDLAYKTQRRVFLSTGMNAMADFLRAAEGGGLDLKRATAALELGCGGGRLIRHLRGIEGLQLTGSDVIQENVNWCRQNLDGIEFRRNGLQPPLAFAADESYDFIFAYSVFTHVPMEWQRPWMAEFARILKPGGVATVTVLGPEMAEKMMSPEEFAEFEAKGEFTMGPDHPRVSASSRIIGSWDVFMTNERVVETYAPELEVVSHSTGTQSIVTLRRR